MPETLTTHLYPALLTATAGLVGEAWRGEAAALCTEKCIGPTSCSRWGV
ncbi:MAG: hypothetical protein IJ789_07330 [Bacteroidales bacterium]|nr:hypothetical protein [Bacteroidales bacterium]